jgi:hypothetical protein
MSAPLPILASVRRGFALASPEQNALLGACPDVGRARGALEQWLPRWALEMAASLAAVGYPPGRIRRVFALGRDRVLAELADLVRDGQRKSVLSSRQPYQRSAIDQLTEEAMRESLEHHSLACKRCSTGRRCFPASQLEEELGRLFPEERRGAARVSPGDGPG